MTGSEQRVWVVEDDPFLRVVQIILDPAASEERRTAFAEFFEHDLPDFEGWCQSVRDEIGAVWPAQVRTVSTQEELRAALPGAEVVVVESLEVGEAELAVAADLKVVQKFGTIMRNIDEAACAGQGVKLLAQRRRANVACAEQTIALMLMLGKKLNQITGRISFEQLREAGFEPKLWDRRHTATSGWARVPGIRMLYESTLGIVGMGEIGRELALRAAPFGMRLLYHQRTQLSESDERLYNLEYASLDRLLAESDWVSIQLPSTPSTRNFIGREELAAMKPGAVLVNTSRPEIIDRDAVLDALREGELGGFGLDTVYEVPGRSDDELLGFDNVVITPWTAAQPRFNALSDLREMVLGIAGSLKA